MYRPNIYQGAENQVSVV